MSNRFSISILAPNHLTENSIALQEWRRVISLPELRITPLDELLFVEYCLVYAEVLELRALIAQAGDSAAWEKRLEGKMKLARRLADELLIPPPNFDVKG